MIDYDFKERLNENNSKYIDLMAVVFSKHTGIDKEKLKEFLTKKLDLEYESFFKNISEDKYNKDIEASLNKMSLDEIMKKSIKD
jgi:type III secretory pathway component EscR